MKMKKVCILCALVMGISSVSACGSQTDVDTSETSQEDSTLEDDSSADDENKTDDLDEMDTETEDIETEDTETFDVSKADLLSSAGYSIPEKLYITDYFRTFDWDSFPEKVSYEDWSKSEYCVKYPWNMKSFEENFVTEDEEKVDLDAWDYEGWTRIYPVDYVNGLWSVTNFEYLEITLGAYDDDESLSEKERTAYCVENNLWTCDCSAWEIISTYKLAEFFETKGVPDHFFVSELLEEEDEHDIRCVHMLMQYEYDDFSIILPVIAEFTDDADPDEDLGPWWMYPIGSPEIYADFVNQDDSMTNNSPMSAISNNYLEMLGGAANYWDPSGIYNFVQVR